MIDFLRAGDSNGDAIVVKSGDTKDGNFYLQVVDGGFTDTGDQIITHIKQHFAEKAKIADVVLSHADNDHATGLIKVLECEDFTISNLWMNRPWDYVDEVIESFHGAYTREGLIKKMREMHPYLVEMEKIAAKRGITVRAPLQGAKIGPFTVLAPSRARYVQLIPDLDKTPPSYASESKGILGLSSRSRRTSRRRSKSAWTSKRSTTIRRRLQPRTKPRWCNGVPSETSAFF
jgi:hypothetical protein